MVLEKYSICKYEVTWEKNDLVNESALNQKAFILLCTHRCFLRDYTVALESHL